jgi:hypothetical protein
MHLKCKVCEQVQTVSTADEADEDARSQLIRRMFRAEHVASCGDGAVSLILRSLEATYVDPELWNRYLDTRIVPGDVTVQADGFFSRRILRDGVAHQVRVCEDCWKIIPRYVDYPAGLVSPESDGANGTVPKWRPGTVETENPDRSAAAYHLFKAVCVPCYIAAFHRVYPEATLAPMSEMVIGDGTPIEPEPPVEAETLGRVSLSMPRVPELA